MSITSAECGVWSAEGKARVASLRRDSAFPLPPSAFRRRPLLFTRSSLLAPRSSLLAPRSSHRGVTLIELLVVILIISILAALILGVAAIAGETAREAGTKHTVQRLHQLLTEFYGTFKTRRVRINPTLEANIDANTALNSADKGRLKAEARLYALREIMLMEMPDHWSDVLLNSVPTASPGNAAALAPVYLDASGTLNGRTQLGAAYLRRYYQIANNTTTEKLLENQGAECLYMVITMACGDGEARTLFGEHLIGDTDGDGAPEFLDGWGHPINFLRWAPGFDSQIQLDLNHLDALASGTSAEKEEAQKLAAGDHDPFDMFRVDPLVPATTPYAKAVRLVPLIYSGGRDESYGIRDAQTLNLITGKQYVAWQGINKQNLVSPSPPQLSPYQLIADPLDDKKVYLGTAIDGTATDNIHNHLLGLR